LISKTLGVGWRAFKAICVLAGLIILIGLFVQRVVLGIYLDEELSSLPSPDGSFIASINRQNQVFDTETKVILKSKVAPWESKAVIVYETVEPPQLSITWKDNATLKVSIPCLPPNSIRPMFYGGGDGPRSRIIVETVPRDSSCQFGRGFIPDEGFPGEFNAPQP
jgi:hypothetical protein